MEIVSFYIFSSNFLISELPTFSWNHSPYFLKALPLYDLDETCYINSFWDDTCDGCILFLEIPPAPPPEFFPLPSPQTFALVLKVWGLPLGYHLGFTIVRFG